MTHGEIEALKIADKYKGKLSDIDKVKKLGEELVELAIAIQENNDENIQEEIGDCVFLLLHILSRHNKSKHSNINLGLVDVVLRASDKMEIRNT